MAISEDRADRLRFTIYFPFPVSGLHYRPRPQSSPREPLCNAAQHFSEPE
jgi:hypothetical protein